MKLLDKAVQGWIYVWGEEEAKGIAIIFTVIMALVTFGTVCKELGIFGLYKNNNKGIIMKDIQATIYTTGAILSYLAIYGIATVAKTLTSFFM